MPDTPCSGQESSSSDQSWPLSCAGALVPSCCKEAGIRRGFSTAQRIGGTSWWRLWKIPLQISMSVTTGLEDDVPVAVLTLMFRTCMETINPDLAPHIPPVPVLPPTHTLLSREVQKLWQLMTWVESAALHKCLYTILNTDLLKSHLFFSQNHPQVTSALPSVPLSPVALWC